LALNDFCTFSAYSSRKIPYFRCLTEKLRTFQYTLDNCQREFNEEVRRMTDVIPKKVGFLKPCFALTEEEPSATEKANTENSVTYTLKVRASATGPNPQSYKLILRRFEEGTPEALIKAMQGLEEVWTQNSVGNVQDRIATIRTILRGASLGQFNAQLNELMRSENELGEVEMLPATTEFVTESLNEVGRNVFPHRALENQKQWLRRHLRKPADMPFRKLASAVVRINNYLPYLPGATENDLFTDTEVVEILEFSLPQAWKAKFDLEGFVPSDNDRQALVRKCEALERSLPVAAKQRPAKKTQQSKHKPGNKKSSTEQSKYCSLHGTCAHTTSECRTLQSQRDSKSKNGHNKKFTASKFRKEINAMTIKNPKKRFKALESFAAVIAKEQKRLKKEANDSDASADKSSDDSADKFHGLIDGPVPRPRKKPAAKTIRKKKGPKRVKPLTLIKSHKERAITPIGVLKKPFKRVKSPNSPKLTLLTGDVIVTQAEKIRTNQKLFAERLKKSVKDQTEKRTATNDSTTGTKPTAMSEHTDRTSSVKDKNVAETDDLTERLERLGLPVTATNTEKPAGATVDGQTDQV